MRWGTRAPGPVPRTSGEPPGPECQPCPFLPRGPYLDTLEHVLKGPGDDASLGRWVRQALHGEGLPAARLAVGEDGAVVALGDTLHGRTTAAPLSWPGPAGLGPLPGAPAVMAPGRQAARR